MQWAMASVALLGGAVILSTQTAAAQAGSTPAPQQPQAGTSPAPAAKPSQPSPLQLRSLDPTTQADPFPRPNPENFTADAPTVATVEGYLRTVLGWDQSRIWRVEAIQKTSVPGMSKVVTLVAQRGAPANKVQTAVFYVLPDGRHLMADANGPQPFGVTPYADNRALLQARADGPSTGAASKDLELVEFSDLQCPRCKDAQATMKRLADEFPKAHLVYEPFPLTEPHPYAYEAASWGACIALSSAQAYLTYADAVYATQADLAPDKVEDTLTAAVNKAGLDPTKVSECSKSKLAKDYVAAGVKLGQDVGVETTPTLMVNGRPLPISGIQYETLKQIIVHQAQLDGVAGAAGTPLLSIPQAAPGTAPHP